MCTYKKKLSKGESLERREQILIFVNKGLSIIIFRTDGFKN